MQNSITAAVSTDLVRTLCYVAKGIKVVTQLTLSWDYHRLYKRVQGRRNGFLRDANVQARRCYTLSHTAPLWRREDRKSSLLLLPERLHWSYHLIQLSDSWVPSGLQKPQITDLHCCPSQLYDYLSQQHH